VLRCLIHDVALHIELDMLQLW